MPATPPPETRKAALLRISGRLIAKMVHLPDGWEVHRIVQPINVEYDDAIGLVVTGEGLPEVQMGMLLPELIPTVTQHKDGSITVEFDMWEALKR